jgi:hypothetical protein
MWEPRRLTTLRATTNCSSDSSLLLLLLLLFITISTRRFAARSCTFHASVHRRTLQEQHPYSCRVFCAIVSTTRCAYKTSILPMDFATVGRRPYVYSKSFIHRIIVFHYDWNHQHSQRAYVVRRKFAFESISQLQTTVWA